jgi:hypothetical protein
LTRLTVTEAKRIMKAAGQALDALLSPPGPDSSPPGTKVRDPKPKRSRTLERMLEDEEQINLFCRVSEYLHLVPALSCLYHVPNGESRGEKVRRVDRRTGEEYWFSPVGAKLKRMGVKEGVSDLALDWPMPRDPGDPGPDGSGWYHGAKIELKRVGGEKPTGPQADYLREMEARGYFVAVCYGAEEVWRALQDYLWLDMPKTLIPEATPRPGPMRRKRELVLKPPAKVKSQKASPKLRKGMQALLF